MSGPLLDRIDLHVELGPVDARALDRTRRRDLEPPAEAAERLLVKRARAAQAARSGRLNVALTPRELESVAPLSLTLRALLADALERLGLSARGYHRTWRVARTIADLAGVESVAPSHMAEALQYREAPQGPWS